MLKVCLVNVRKKSKDGSLRREAVALSHRERVETQPKAESGVREGR